MQTLDSMVGGTLCQIRDREHLTFGIYHFSFVISVVRVRKADQTVCLSGSAFGVELRAIRQNEKS